MSSNVISSSSQVCDRMAYLFAKPGFIAAVVVNERLVEPHQPVGFNIEQPHCRCQLLQTD